MTRVTITSEREDDNSRPIIVFSWELTAEQLQKLSDFASDLADGEV